MTLNINIAGYVCPSLIEWEGIVSCVIFTQGCNLRCGYCYNPSLVGISNTSCKLDEILDLIERNRKFIDGVVICGGEPTIHRSGLVDFCFLLKDLDLKIRVDTNGTNPNIIEELASYDAIDRIALDYKMPTEQGYRRLTGTRINMHSTIIRTMNIAKRYRKELEVRTTVIPTFNDDPSSIAEIARSIAPYADVYYLQQFDNTKDTLDPEFRNIPPPSVKSLSELAILAIALGVNTKIRYRETVESKSKQV